MTGLQFGEWVVLERDINRERQQKEENKCFHDYWICRCSCGTVKSVNGIHLRKGKSKSCGCKQGEFLSKNKAYDISGKRFGKLVAIESTDIKTHNGFVWKCKCDCGNIIEKTVYELNSGKAIECEECRSRGFDSFKSLVMYRRGIKNIKQNGSLYDSLREHYTDEEIQRFWSSHNKFSPNQLTKKSHRNILLICPICGEEYHTSALSLYNRTRSILCPSCLAEEIDSSLEKEVKKYLHEELKLHTLHERRCTIKLKNPYTKNL